MSADGGSAPDAPAALAAEGDEAVLDLLRSGELEPLGVLPRASNFTFLARVRADEGETFAVYKPRAGEAPLWDFPDGTLCTREVAAYVVAAALGWPRVPPTVMRDGPHGPGSVQAFVASDPEQHYFTMREARPDEFRRIALFDVVVNNADRKAGHCLLGEDDRISVVDHGVCFAAEPKLRTVIWDFVDETIPPSMVADLRSLRDRMSGRHLRATLAALLSPGEVAATERRLAELVETGTFPRPGPGRPYPWPIV